MFRVTVAYAGVSADVGISLAAIIQNHFPKHGRRYKTSQRIFTSGELRLTVDNKLDPEGGMLTREFLQCLSLYVTVIYDARARFVSALLLEKSAGRRGSKLMLRVC